MSDQFAGYTGLRTAARQNLRDLVPLPSPFTVYVEPTNICNFKCSYCPISFDDYAERSGGLGRLTLESCERIYDEILTLGRIRTLNLYMLGEPYANRDLTRFIALAKEKGVADRVIVTTNGTLLDEAAARRTIESRLDYLRVSVYGTSSDGMRAVTGSKIPLERIVENVARLKRLRDEARSSTPFIYCKMIETDDPAESGRFLELFRPISDQVELEPAMNWNVPQEAADLSGRGARLIQDDYFRNRKSACPFPFYTLVINADLRVTVCCVDWERATEIGNLRFQSLREIWHGSALREFRIKHLMGRREDIAACRSCTYLHTAPDNVDGLSAADFAARAA